MLTSSKIRAVTSGQPHFFGYYDKCPWSADGKKLLGIRATFQDRPQIASDVAVLGTIDIESGAFEPFAETTAWNWQQGTMLQWLPNPYVTLGGKGSTTPARATNEVIYNARRKDGSLCGIVQNLSTGKKRELSRPVYAVHPDGHEGISLDFHRLQTLRAGYGYAPGVEITSHNLAPDDVGLWRVDLKTGESKLIYSIAEAQAFNHDPRSVGVPNWFNHATYNTDGSRFCFLNRFKDPNGPAGQWQTRLITIDSQGRNPYLLAGRGMVSHFAWKNPRELLAWSWPQPREVPAKMGYYVFTDLTQKYELIGDNLLTLDGHMTYAPNLRTLITDEYPGPDGAQPLFLFDLASNKRIDIGRFKAPLSLELRCDLHPRWNAAGTHVCFDSAHSGTRQIYIADVRELLPE